MPSEEPSLTDKFDRALGASSTHFDTLSQELTDATHSLRQMVAKRLEPVLNARIQAMPQETLEQKKAIQNFIFNTLEPLSLAVQCPKTNRPGKLKATTGNKPGSSSFHYEIYIDGKREFTSVSDDLPTLKLIDGFPHPEIQSHFRDLVKRSLKQNDRGK